MKRNLIIIISVVAISVAAVSVNKSVKAWNGLKNVCQAGFLTSCTTQDQSIVKEQRQVSNFNEIGFALPGTVTVTFGNEFKVELEGPKDFISKIETKVSGGDLEIKTDSWIRNINQSVNVYITMPSLKGVAVSGSGKVDVKDPLKTDSFDAAVSGSGDICIKDVEINSLECAISGSGTLQIEGSGAVTSGELSISGSGKYMGPDTKVSMFEVEISGSGRCDCYVTEKLEAAISGSGNVTYSGKPKVDAAISGSGHVRTK